jgi:hypothetical protein
MEMMRNEQLRGRAKDLARIAPTYFFMYFLGPVVWQLWMALRLGFVSLEESRRCLLSPYTIAIEVFLFALNTANLARGMRSVRAEVEGAAPLRLAIHCASLLAFATIGTAASMSALSGSAGGESFTPLKLIVGSLNGASMCFAFYTASTASAIARLATPGGRSSEGERRLLARTRAFNAWLFAIGTPLFIATSLAAASLGDGASAAGATARLLASMAVPLTMGGALFVRADGRIASLLGATGKELAR